MAQYSGAQYYSQPLPEKLYHYTDNNGRQQIEDSGIILMSTEFGNTPDAMYGTGVYFTSIPPSWPTQKIIGNNWDGNRVLARRTEYFFEFDLRILGWQFQNNLEKVGDHHGRDIWLYRAKSLPLPHGMRAQRRNTNN